MKKLIFFVTIVFCLFIEFNSLSATNVFAVTTATTSAKATPTPKVTPTPTPTPTPSVNEAEVNDNLLKRIQENIEENKAQVQERIDKINQKKLGIIGQVQRVSKETLTIKSTAGVQILAIDEKVSLIKSGKTIPTEQIAIDDFALLIGKMVNDDYVPEKITFTSRNLRPRDQIVQLGTIIKIDKNGLTFTPRGSEEEKQITFTKTANFIDSQGEKALRTNFSVNMQCLLVGYKDETGNYATTIKALAPFSK